MIIILQGDWSTVCIRGCTPEVVEADECIEFGESPKLSILDIETSPFKRNLINSDISIFDVYRNPTEESDDGLSDEFLSDEEDISE